MSTFLVLGGTGKTGRRLARRLTEAGHTVRAASRSGDVRFDWADPATHDTALAGADGVYVVPPALRLDWGPDVAALLARAEAHGVRRAVLLGARGGQLDPSGPLAVAEAALREGGLEWTVVRPSWFMQNFTEGLFAGGLREGVLVAPAGQGAHPFVDVEDIAAVAAAALTEDGHAGQAYDLSGPEALTFAQAAEALGARHVDPGLDAWRAEAVAHGLPEPYADLLGRLFGLIAAGDDAQRSDGVQRALGREPSSFAAWAEREAGALRRAAA
jgi:uncharacterized protein YbjT (DUF2867 family)